MFFSSIKEINMYVKHLLLRETDVLKTSILSERKFKGMVYFEEEKVQGIFGETFIFGIIAFSCNEVPLIH